LQAQRTGAFVSHVVSIATLQKTAPVNKATSAGGRADQQDSTRSSLYSIFVRRGFPSQSSLQGPT